MSEAHEHEHESDAVDVHDPRVVDSIDRYWRKNVAIMVTLLAVWAVAGLGCGVLFADRLNEVRFGGFPLGFWFAQQGSILIFVVLVLVYAALLNRLDAKHHEELKAIRRDGSSGHAAPLDHLGLSGDDGPSGDDGAAS